MPNIIPQPVKIQPGKGAYLLDKTTKILCHQEAQYLADYLSEQILQLKSLDLESENRQRIDMQAENAILLLPSREPTNKTEGYALTIDKNNIIIKAADNAGLFYGIQSLLQIVQDNKTALPAVMITDYPSYQYRGVHLDVGRHFFPVEFIKKYIDMLAMHKMNIFHWHLTEDQGWRIEIKKYPKLTEIGAYRKETVVGHAGQSDEYDGTPYGGFYTQEEIREIVKYAESRHVTVIPEIELPGHSMAALAAYPELGCTGGPYEVATTWGVFKDVFCAGNEKVFEFMEDVLTEVMALFPGKYIHIGGDECPKDRWKNCPKCQQRIKDKKLANEHELQSYFITRIEKFLNANGRKIIGWDEILEGGLAPGATVMSWRGIQGGLEAARSEHDVIMTPNSHCYFDYYQALPEYEPLAIGGYLTLKKVYSFDPVPETLEKKYQKYIIGGQANLWTEYMKTSDHVEYMLNPRLAALSEVLWTPRENRDWQDFQSRLQAHFQRLEQKNINYSKGTYKVDIKVDVDNAQKEAYVKLKSQQYQPVIRYTLDGMNPDNNSRIYTKPFKIDQVIKVKAAIFIDGEPYRGISEKTIGIHQALGAEVHLKNQYSQRYAAGGKQALVDGLTGSGNFGDGYWQGYEGDDFEAVLDLGEMKDISKVRVNFIEAWGSWIFLPEKVVVSISKNGQDFTIIQSVNNDYPLIKKEARSRTFGAEFEPLATRYIKVHAANIKTCPENHPGAGGKAWLFVDEIIVE